MAETNSLKVEKRSDFGKGFARRARVDGKIPAVIYGHGVDPIHVALPYHETFLLVKDNPNAVISIEGLEAKTMVLVKDIQRHPLKRVIMHMDLLIVKADEKVDVEVPVELIGEPQPGLVANHELLNIEISAPVTDIPEKIEVSIEGLEEGTVIKVSDLILPQDVEAKTDAESIVLSVIVPQEVAIPEDSATGDEGGSAEAGNGGAGEGEAE